MRHSNIFYQKRFARVLKPPRSSIMVVLQNMGSSVVAFIPDHAVMGRLGYGGALKKEMVYKGDFLRP